MIHADLLTMNKGARSTALRSVQETRVEEATASGTRTALLAHQQDLSQGYTVEAAGRSPRMGMVV